MIRGFYPKKHKHGKVPNVSMSYKNMSGTQMPKYRQSYNIGHKNIPKRKYQAQT